MAGGFPRDGASWPPDGESFPEVDPTTGPPPVDPPVDPGPPESTLPLNPGVTITTSNSLPTVQVKLNRGFQFVLYESNLFDTDAHPITGEPTPGIHTHVRTFQQAKDRSISYTLNRPGSAKFSLPLIGEEALDVVGKEIKRCIVVFIDPEDLTDPTARPEPIWAGYVSAVELDSDSARISVTCTGWLQFIYGREFRQTIQFNGEDAGRIGARLFGTACNQIANDAPVEDLLGTAGDLDDTFSLGGPAVNWTTGPNAVNDWDWTQTILPSGSGGMGGTAVNINGTSLQPVGVPIQVDDSQGYNIGGLIYIYQTGGTGTQEACIFLDWTDEDGDFISRDTVAATGLGTYVMADAVTSPVGATHCQVNIGFITSDASNVGAVFDSLHMSIGGVERRGLPMQLGTLDFPANFTGAERTRTYQVGDKIGNGIEELSNIEGGYDFECGLQWVNYNVAGVDGWTVLREFNIKFGQVKAGTTIYGIGQDRPDVVFAQNWAGLNNLSAVRETRDGTNLATRMNARGPADSGGASQLAMAQALDQIEEVGLWEDSANLTDSGIGPDVLLAYAGAEVVFRSAPTRRFNPTPRPYDGTTTIPRVKADYDIGDIGYMVVDNGAMQIGVDINQKQPIRLFGFTISVDDEDNERVSEFQTTVSS